MADLITVARAKQNIAAQTTFTTAETDLITILVSAVSAATIAYCRQPFVKTDFVELYSGTNRPILQLNQYPVWEVTRVSTNIAPILQITNTSTSVYRALAGVTKDVATPTPSVIIRWLTSAGWTQQTFGDVGEPHLTNVKSAIDGYSANGWAATIITGFEYYRTADLATQPLRNALNRAADITAHIDDLADYDLDGPKGQVIKGSSHGVNKFELDAPVWLTGINNYRVEYTACGEEYSSSFIVPYDVQDAVAQWVAMLYFQTKRDPGLVQSSLLNIGTVITLVNRQGVPKHVAAMLAPHRRFRLGHSF